MSPESILSFMILWLPPASQIERKWDIWPNYNHFLSFSSLFLYALIFFFLSFKNILNCCFCWCAFIWIRFYCQNSSLDKFSNLYLCVYLHLFFSLWENYADLCICSIFLQIFVFVAFSCSEWVCRAALPWCGGTSGGKFGRPVGEFLFFSFNLHLRRI